jgi:AcrR family transcriptional regulator
MGDKPATRRKPVQKRSRERVEQILLASADVLAGSSGPDDLTTTSVSKRSGIPVATIYRYFADRMAIIAALIDRETAEIDDAIVERLNNLETVSLDSLLETMMLTHLRHFQSHKRSIVLWFGARNSKRVLDRVDRRYAYLGRWVLESSLKAGFLQPQVPTFGGEAIVWMCDRAFEFIFREERAAPLQLAIMREFLEMMETQIHKYATPEGLTGIPREQFMAMVEPFDPVGSLGDDDET